MIKATAIISPMFRNIFFILFCYGYVEHLFYIPYIVECQTFKVYGTYVLDVLAVVGT